MHRFVRLVVGIGSPLLGVPGNVLIFLVFARRRQKNAGDIAIMALAIDDLISSMFNALKVAVFFSGVSDVYCIIEMVSLRSGVLAAAFLTVTIAVYRFRAVVTPFSRPTSLRSAACVSLGCLASAFVFNSPAILLNRAVEREGNIMCVAFGDMAWVGITYSWSQTAVFSLSSLISSLLYFKIFRVIRGQQVVRRELTSGHLARKDTLPAVYQISSTVAADHKSVIKITDSVDNTGAGSSFKLSTYSTNKDCIRGNQTEGTKPDDRGNSTLLEPANDEAVEGATGETTATTADQPTARKIPSQTTSRKKDSYDHRTTLMLLIVCIVFFLSWLPSVVFDVYSVREGSGSLSFHDQHPLPAMLVYAVTQIKYINHIINVFIYAFVNRRFRKECIQLLSCK
ncbi:uncharacterized protein [Diadema setosum]|uniref:uncharacterized protein n=1 Tax=Diadema setosum TaxID=31175 RepID=UPI003B3A2C6E